MSSKRRAYPKVAYQMDQAPAQQFGGVPAGGVYQQPQQQPAAFGQQPAYGQPQQAYGQQPQAQQPLYGMPQQPIDPVSQATQGFQNMNLGGAGNVEGVGAAAPNAGGMPGVVPGPYQAQFSAPGYPGQAPQQPQYGYQQQQQQQQQPQLQFSAGAYGSQAPLINNQLYPIDLLTQLPPPIADLNLPPPSINLPASALLTQSPDSTDATPKYIRCTLNAIPKTNSLLRKSKLPLAISVTPYTTLLESDNRVPVQEDTYICRCRRCRAYINPFISLTADGRRWKCNFCNLNNDFPTAFDIHPITGKSRNRYERPELNHGMVDYIAPTEYTSRPPQALSYVFLLEVTTETIKSGLLSIAARTILESLDRIPNEGGRTKVGFLGVNSALHFFKIPTDKPEKPKSENSSEADEDEEDDDDDLEPEMLVVPDLEEPFLPVPGELLVNLNDARKGIEKLLNNLSNMFINTVDSKFALGPALKSAHKLLESFGGKIIVISSSLPTVGVGKLSPRNEDAVSGTNKEASSLLSNANSFYKSFAVECTKVQVSVDMFLASGGYQDVASLSNLPRYTSGQTHFYPSWTAANESQVTKLSQELLNHLSMEIAVEAVLRVRGSTGVRMTTFYGNFFNRSSDLCCFPVFPRDQSYMIEMSIEENLSAPTICIQAAVLHTNYAGERRVRVCTICLPTTDNLNQLYASADQLTIAQFYIQKAAEKVYNSGLQEARDLMTKYMADMLTVYKKELIPGNSGTSNPLQIASNLKILPLLMQAANKHLAFRSGKVPSDHRASALNYLTTQPLDILIKSLYPTIYSLHDMADEAGLPDETSGEFILPQPINDSGVNLANYGLYLFDNSTELFLWVGGEAMPQLVEDVFGTNNIYEIPTGMFELPVVQDSEFNERIGNIIGKIRENKNTVTRQNLYIVRGGSPNEMQTANLRDLNALRMWALTNLVEDRALTAPSYREYLGALNSKMST